MPQKNGARYCINHPEQPLVLVSDRKQRVERFIHVTQAAVSEEGRYVPHEMMTGVNLYACGRCGYVETYLIEAEIDLLRS